MNAKTSEWNAQSLKIPSPNTLITKGKGNFRDTQQLPPQSWLKLTPPLTGPMEILYHPKRCDEDRESLL